MKDSDGEVCAFSATGQSAIVEIAELVGMYASADRQGKFPIIELDTRNKGDPQCQNRNDA